MNQSTNRATLLGVAGGYLLYLAYELLKSVIDQAATSMPLWAMILAIAAFTGAGITLLIYAWRIWKAGREDRDQEPVELEKEEAEPSSAPEETGTEDSEGEKQE